MILSSNVICWRMVVVVTVDWVSCQGACKVKVPSSAGLGDGMVPVVGGWMGIWGWFWGVLMMLELLKREWARERLLLLLLRSIANGGTRAGRSLSAQISPEPFLFTEIADKISKN